MEKNKLKRTLVILDQEYIDAAVEYGKSIGIVTFAGIVRHLITTNKNIIKHKDYLKQKKGSEYYG